MTLDFEQARARYDELNERAAIAGRALAAYPGAGSGPLGLTPDDVKRSPGFIAAQRAYRVAFEQARTFNAIYCRRFKRELAEERRARRASGRL